MKGQTSGYQQASKNNQASKGQQASKYHQASNGQQASRGEAAINRQVPARAPDCLKCRHFFVTWDARFPRGCRVFGVKTRGLPSIAVYRSTGHQCPAFEKAPRIKD